MENKNDVGLKRDLGPASAFAMVVGCVIGTGIFMAPQNLASVSNPKTSIMAWVITGFGSICIALCFGNMVKLLPKTGGPVVYAKTAFGDFAGFLIAWSYWFCCWVCFAAIITGCVRYLGILIPGLVSNRLAGFIASSIIVWALCFLNMRGVKYGGGFQVVTTVCKLIPIVVFIIIAAFHFDPALFNTVSKPELSGSSTMPAAIAVAMWSLSGFEMATFPAGETKNAGKAIQKAVILGTIFVVIIYILISFLSSGIMSQSELANSNAPISDMLNAMTGGTWGGIFIAIGVVISTLGAANGSVITLSRCSFAAAEDNMFPSIFGKIHPKYRTPNTSIIIGGILANLLLIMNYVGGLNAAYSFMLLLGTLSSLPAYIATELAEILLIRNNNKNFSFGSFLKNSIVPLIAFVYTLYVIYGTGADAALWGFILIIIGLPFYVYNKLQQKNKGVTFNGKTKKVPNQTLEQ